MAVPVFAPWPPVVARAPTVTSGYVLPAGCVDLFRRLTARSSPPRANRFARTHPLSHTLAP
ncbi:hypothetical protein GCM10012287_27250 [Streptomyces daqingensis]|uniref:Uncharacterized protein n=1 Tax=Streptomyces daqingensis TaxID=1472640 RepID=A0ABQ2MCP5_9ACTN|nr:hypothetical protein GCM10012287_27250 [Streptomyces daqingensis]